MPNVLTLMPQLEGEEAMYVQHLISGMTEEQAMQFAFIYKERRKDPQLILLLAVVGYFGIAGVQRFVVDQIGMGILYFITFGFCGIGTIIDMINYKSITWEYNRMKAEEIAHLGGWKTPNYRM